jgi:hypothetical protein
MSSGQDMMFESRLMTNPLILPMREQGEVAAKPTEGPRESAENTAVTPALFRSAEAVRPPPASGVLPHRRWGRRRWPPAPLGHEIR